MNNKLKNKINIAVLAGFSFALVLTVHVPIFPPAPFLKYDIADVPALLAGFAMGPLSGLAVVVIRDLLLLLYKFSPVELLGVPMNFLSGSVLVGVSSWYYWKNKTIKNAILSLILGTLVATITMIPANYLVFDTMVKIFHMEGAYSASYYVIMLCTPFNFLKGALSSLIAFSVYKRVSKFIR